MSGPEVAFVVIGGAVLVAAFLLVTTRNVMHGALYLALALGGIAGVFVLLGAPFLAWVQVLVYVGAVVVLMMFALMLTKAPIGRQSLDNNQWIASAFVAMGIAVGLGWLVQNAWGGAQIDPSAVASSSESIGSAIFTAYVLPFEAVSFLLLAALIGAVVLAKKDDA